MAQVIDFLRNVIPMNWQSSPVGGLPQLSLCVTNGESRPTQKVEVVFDDEGLDTTVLIVDIVQVGVKVKV